MLHPLIKTNAIILPAALLALVTMVVAARSHRSAGAVGKALPAPHFYASAMLTVVGIAVILICAVATYQRNEIWKDEITVWTDVVQKSPRNSRAHNNLGAALMSQGKLASAIEHLLAAEELEPRDFETENNLGLAYVRTGKPEDSIAHFRAALELKPNSAEVHENLGEALVEMGDLPEAIREYQVALRSQPNHVSTYNNLGVAYFKMGMVDNAIAQFRTAIDLQPDNADAHYNLGIALGRKGQTAAANEEMSIGMKLRSSGKR